MLTAFVVDDHVSIMSGAKRTGGKRLGAGSQCKHAPAGARAHSQRNATCSRRSVVGGLVHGAN